MNIFSNFGSQLFRGSVSTNSVSYINKQNVNVSLDPSGTDYIDYSNNNNYFEDAYGINLNDENTTSLLLNNSQTLNPFSLSSLDEFTIYMKYKVHDVSNLPILGQIYTNPNYEISFSNIFPSIGDTFTVTVLNGSNTNVTYTISGDITSADLSYADMSGVLTDVENSLTYTLKSGSGLFLFLLDNTDISASFNVLKPYFVIVQNNVLGEPVFAFSETGEVGPYYNQPELSFGAGDKFLFDVSDRTMADISFVFGTTVDNSSTIIDSFVTYQDGLVMLDICSGYVGESLKYFEDTSAGMGYYSALGTTASSSVSIVSDVIPETSESGSNNLYSFTETDISYSFKVNGSINCDILIVGAGGGGIGGSPGGGAGGVLYLQNVTLADCSYDIIVGNSVLGGDGKSSFMFNKDTTINDYIGYGGGKYATDGASGGGRGLSDLNEAVPTYGNLAIYPDNSGNNGGGVNNNGNWAGVGGGGGAGEAGKQGGNARGDGSNQYGGSGGDGVVCDILGPSYYWGGGGGAYNHINEARGSGGKGGGGAGSAYAISNGFSGTEVTPPFGVSDMIYGINPAELELTTDYGTGAYWADSEPIFVAHGGKNTGGGGGGGYGTHLTAGGTGIVVIKTPFIQSIQSYTVTIGLDSLNTKNVFYFNDGTTNYEAPSLQFIKNTLYIFDQSDESNAGNTIVFGTNTDVLSSLVDYQNVVGMPGQSGAYTSFTAKEETIYYFSYEQVNMGYQEPYTMISSSSSVYAGGSVDISVNNATNVDVSYTVTFTGITSTDLSGNYLENGDTIPNNSLRVFTFSIPSDLTTIGSFLFSIEGTDVNTKIAVTTDPIHRYTVEVIDSVYWLQKYDVLGTMGLKQPKPLLPLFEKDYSYEFYYDHTINHPFALSLTINGDTEYTNGVTRDNEGTANAVLKLNVTEDISLNYYCKNHDNYGNDVSSSLYVTYESLMKIRYIFDDYKDLRRHSDLSSASIKNHGSLGSAGDGYIARRDGESSYTTISYSNRQKKVGNYSIYNLAEAKTNNGSDKFSFPYGIIANDKNIVGSTTGFTLMLWIYEDEQSINDSVWVARGLIGLRCGPNDNNTTLLVGELGITVDGSTQQESRSNNINSWHHFAIKCKMNDTENGRIITAFYDGQKIGESTSYDYRTEIPFNMEQGRVGVGDTGFDFMSVWGNNKSFRGYMDDIRLYDEHLPDSEILRVYNETL